MLQTGLNSLEDLQRVLGEFADMQGDHSVFLMADDLKSLSGWLAKRQHLECRLRACLDEFDFGSVAADSELAVRIKESVATIKKEDEALACLVKNKQGDLKEKLRTMRQGKAMLSGYGSSCGAGSKPKFLSSRT